ncbi:MAG: hypothetical protein GDA42_10110 [Ekhidna sp.]|nr:hypothetical protein [Ekhidna sp.]
MKFGYNTDLNGKIRLKGSLKSIEETIIGQEEHLTEFRNKDTPLFLKRELNK